MTQFGQELASWWELLGPLGTLLLVGMVVLAIVAMFQSRGASADGDYTTDGYDYSSGD